MPKGSCLCGDIRFELSDGAWGTTEACHCTQCRKQSGHFWTSSDISIDDITVTGDVTWYASSDVAERGFCPRCGSLLFWSEHERGRMNVSMGAFDDPTGIAIDRHIFVASKGDYYDISDGLPQHDTYPEEPNA